MTTKTHTARVLSRGLTTALLLTGLCACGDSAKDDKAKADNAKTPAKKDTDKKPSDKTPDKKQAQTPDKTPDKSPDKKTTAPEPKAAETDADKAKRALAMLQGLLAANTEYKARFDMGPINHVGKYPIDWADIDATLSSAERFAFACKMAEPTEKMMLAALGADGEDQLKLIYADNDGDGFPEIYDPWGTQIEYRTFNPGTGLGSETGVDNAKLPISKSPLFISAGPDKTFGKNAEGVSDDIVAGSE